MVLINPIQHPGAVVRGAWQKEPCQETYLRRLGLWLKGKVETPEIDVDQAPPDSILFPTVDDLYWFTQSQFDNAQLSAVSIDIENAGSHIICIGCTALSLETGEIGWSVCARFRRRGGGLWWKSNRDLLGAIEWLYDLLQREEVAKVFHNGVVYDVPILEELGFTVRGRLIDTLNLAHCAYPELSKGLQFCATLYLWSPCWKLLSDEADEAEGKA